MDGVMGDAGIGRRVRASRARLGWSREKLAASSGLSWSAIAQVETGRRENPRPATLSALARALGVSIDYLVDGGTAATAMLEHRALIYASDHDYSRATAAFLREGLDRSEPALTVTTERNADLIRTELGADAERVRFEEASVWLRTPDAALTGFTDFVSARIGEGASWVRIIGEPIWNGRSDEEVRHWARFESIVNMAFAASPASFLCPYDERALAPAVIAQARATHPQVVAAGVVEDSDSYQDPFSYTIGG